MNSDLLLSWPSYATAVIGAVCFAVVFRTPRHYFLQTVLVGFVSCMLPRFLPADWSVGFSTFVTALGIGALSHMFARVTRAPAQCFLIPGIIFLVPGTYIYRAFSAALASQGPEAAALAIAAVTITCGISFGLLFANVVLPSKKTL